MKACKECPYRKDSAPGWLGESSGDPVDFLTQLDSPVMHPCHMAVNWEENESYLGASVCKGALQFAKNTCKMLGDKRGNDLRSSLTIDTTEIFETRQKFIEHHNTNN